MKLFHVCQKHLLLNVIAQRFSGKEVFLTSGAHAFTTSYAPGHVKNGALTVHWALGNLNHSIPVSLRTVPMLVGQAGQTTSLRLEDVGVAPQALKCNAEGSKL